MAASASTAAATCVDANLCNFRRPSVRTVINPACTKWRKWALVAVGESCAAAASSLALCA